MFLASFEQRFCLFELISFISDVLLSRYLLEKKEKKSVARFIIFLCSVETFTPRHAGLLHPLILHAAMMCKLLCLIAFHSHYHSFCIRCIIHSISHNIAICPTILHFSLEYFSSCLPQLLLKLKPVIGVLTTIPVLFFLHYHFQS